MFVIIILYVCYRVKKLLETNRPPNAGMVTSVLEVHCNAEFCSNSIHTFPKKSSKSLAGCVKVAGRCV